MILITYLKGRFSLIVKDKMGLSHLENSIFSNYKDETTRTSSQAKLSQYARCHSCIQHASLYVGFPQPVPVPNFKADQATGRVGCKSSTVREKCTKLKLPVEDGKIVHISTTTFYTFNGPEPARNSFSVISPSSNPCKTPMSHL